MLKQILKIGLSIALFSTIGVAQSYPKKLSETFKYDAANGWWWYKETYEDKDKKKFDTTVKMTKKEKIQKDTSDEKIKLMRAQNEKLGKIKERLDYAFPNITPIYSKNSKGEKCLTNSSSDCFIFPLQAEAQHVPVMAKWLSNPSPENSKQWLKWQAKYFNHVTNIGYGNKFAYMKDGSKVYNTDNFYNEGDSLNGSKTSSTTKLREFNVLASLDKKVSNLLFLGKTKSMDTLMRGYNQFHDWDRKGLEKLNIHFIFEGQKDIDYMESKIKNGTPSNWKSYLKLKKAGLIVIRPSYFKKFNITLTPSAITTYMKDPKKGEKGNNFIWQRTVSSTIQPSKVVNGSIQFLIYNKIIEAGELANDKTVVEADRYKKFKNEKIKINEKDIFNSTSSIKAK